MSPVPHDIAGIHYADGSHCPRQLGAVKQNTSYIFSCGSINPDSMLPNNYFTLDSSHKSNEYHYLANLNVKKGS